MKSKAIIFDIQRNSIVDGPGIRTTVFFKGCNLQCQWCHNPESQFPERQLLFYAEKCTDCGACREVCPQKTERCNSCGKCAIACPNQARQLCGKWYTPEELMKLLVKDRRFYEASGGGVTFSGGECMLQIDFLEQMLKLCRQTGIRTAVDTAGYVGWERFLRILPYTDLFLYDVKSMDPKIHREYTGTDNLLILQNLGKLLRAGARVTVRFPVIPGINDNRREMQLLDAFYKENGYPIKTELLPYHGLGEKKYSAVGKEPPRFRVPGAEKIAQLNTALSGLR